MVQGYCNIGKKNQILISKKTLVISIFFPLYIQHHLAFHFLKQCFINFRAKTCRNMLESLGMQFQELSSWEKQMPFIRGDIHIHIAKQNIILKFWVGRWVRTVILWQFSRSKMNILISLIAMLDVFKVGWVGLEENANLMFCMATWIWTWPLTMEAFYEEIRLKSWRSTQLSSTLGWNLNVSLYYVYDMNSTKLSLPYRKLSIYISTCTHK